MALQEQVIDVAHLRTLKEQLNTQGPTLRFLAATYNMTEMPPTPPLEEDLQLGNEDPEMSTGITPAVDESCWIADDPPPEYSPPSDPSSILLAEAEKTDLKIGTRDVSDETLSQASSSSNLCALEVAVKENDSSMLSHLLGKGTDVSARFGSLSRTPLHIAAHLNHCKCILVLLQHGADMSTEDGKGDKALHLAAWSGSVEALALLIAHGADVDWLSGRDGYSALWCAISAKQIDAARLLLKHGARVSLKAASGSGLTPLHQAGITGQSAMCELLLMRGALVDSLDEDRNTPLHYAATSGSVASVAILLRYGADIEAKQAYGLTAAHWAAHKGHTEVLTHLLDRGADINAKAEDGVTCLHLAASRGHVAVVKLLLERGANRRTGSAVWDGVSGTPAEMAKQKKHSRVVRLLRS